MKQFDSPANGSIPAPAGSSYSSATGDSGVIVFSSPTHILHMNRQARSLMALFGESRNAWTLPTHESMPSILIEFYRDVLEQFRDRIGLHDWAQFEMRRVCHMVTPPLLIRGFGIPDSASQHPRVVLTLHTLGPSESRSSLVDAVDTLPRQTVFSSRAAS